MLPHLLEQSSLSKIREELEAYLKKQFKSLLSSPSRHPDSKKTSGFSLEQPRQSEYGHLACPLFHLAKQHKKAPQRLAEELSQKIQSSPPSFLKSCVPLNGFINFQFQDDYIQKHLSLMEKRKNLISFQPEKSEHWVLDFASPNVAKYMNIGHLRAAVLGQALVNLARAFGFKVTAVNHLGDWGSQFGKLLWAYKEWGREYDFKNKAFESLIKLYVRFYEEAESDPQKKESSRRLFKKLEEGDKDLKKLWRSFVNLSIENYSYYWNLFNVRHDLILGESFYVPFVQDLKNRLNKKKLLKQSEGAEVVFLKNSEVPCLISKSDGASTYSSRDLCGIIYRFEKLKANRNIYITGSDQILHFKQIFEVMERLEPEWNNLHLSFGMYRFKGEGKMSTRRGRAVYLQDITEQATQRVEKIIQERATSNKRPAKGKNQPEEDTKEEKNLDPLKNFDSSKIAEQVALGALIFNDLMQDRVKDVDFNWSKVLDFEGNSGPFVQYSLVRSKSLLKKAGFKDEPAEFQSLFEDEEERGLAWLLLEFDSVCFQSLQKLKPHILARYLLNLSKNFNRFYNAKKMIGHPREKDRLLLTKIAHRVLSKGLELLNMPRPPAM